MGNIMSWFESKFYKKKATILMVGLDAAGKTTILGKLKLNEVQETVPTIGFNVETVEYQNVTFHLWDVGGQERLRKLWRHYYDGANAIIFVIDSADIARLGDVKKELTTLLTEPILRDAILLIFCNKQDLPKALSSTGFTEAEHQRNTRNAVMKYANVCQPCHSAVGDSRVCGSVVPLPSNMNLAPPFNSKKNK
eukprot:gene9082-6375_t